MTAPAQIDVKDLIEQRRQRYGAFDDLSLLSQSIKEVMQCHPNWEHMEAYMRESLEMIAHKIARVINGDCRYDDSWIDIAGYAQRVVETLKPSDKS